MDPTVLPKVLFVSLSILAYYGVVAGRMTASAPWITDHFYRVPTFRKYARVELESITRLAVAGLAQLIFLLTLLAIAGLDFRQLGYSRIDAHLLLYGVLLGIGEMCVAAFLVSVLMEAAMLWFPSRVPQRIEDWQQVFAGGWMQTMLKMVELVPLPLALFFIILYVAVEETMFRGFLITVFRADDPGLAIGLSLVLFVGYQIFNMPSWQNALAPLVGSAVVGLVNGMLFLAVPEMLPLVTAHCVMFIVAMKVSAG